MLLYIVTACYALMRALLTLGLLRRLPRADSRPAVSVIVAAHNEAETLPALLDSLCQQTYPDYEVIIVDDRSEDATADLLRDRAARDQRLTVVRIHAVPEDRAPKIHALARGIEQARGELLLLTDADCSVTPGWIAAMASCFRPNVGAVIGYVDLRAPNRTLLEHVQALDYLAMMAVAAGATKLGVPVGGAGANLAYRRVAYDAAGGFDDLPAGSVADDMLLLQRVLDRTEWRVAFCDDSRGIARTAAEPTLKKLLNQRARWIAGGSEVLGRNWPLLVSSALIGLMNGLMACAPLLWCRRDLRRPLLALIAGRTLADALHIGVAARRFHRMELLRYLPMWIVAQLPYTLLLPIYSKLGQWTWRDRQG